MAMFAILAAALASHGAWNLKTITDPITDIDRVILSAKSENALLAFKCDRHGNGRVYAQFISREYLGSGKRPLIYRVDDGEPLESEWEYDTRSAILWDEQAFASVLAGGSKAVIRAHSIGGGQVDAVFDITGSTEAIEQAYRLCGDELHKK